MRINTLYSKVSDFKQYLKGIPEEAETRVTTYGKYKDMHIAIDNFKNSKGFVIQKRYVLWNNEIQLIWYKNRNKDGKFNILF